MKTLLRIALSLGLLLASFAYAQSVDPVRPIPETAPKATMTVVSERVLNLNGKEYMLAPGGVILNDKNLVVLTQSLTDSYVVRVKFDTQIQVQRVWILTAAENEVDAPTLSGEKSFWNWLLPWL